MWEESLYSNDHVAEAGPAPDAAAPGAPSGGPSLRERIFRCKTHLKSAFDENARQHRAVSFDDLHKYAGVDLRRDNEVLEELTQRDWIEFDDEGGTVRFRPKFYAADRASLAVVLRDNTGGMLLDKLKEETGYEGLEKDVASLVRTGEVMAINNDRQKSMSFLDSRFKEAFRDKTFFRVKLPGTVTLSRGSRFARTTDDLRDVIRRGELIFIGNEIKEGRIFRVSTASASGLYSAWRPKLSAAFIGKGGVPDTATIPSRVFPFTASILPLDAVYTGPSESGLHVYRQGFTSLSRRVWDEIAETDGVQNPCVSAERDQDGTILAAVSRCSELGLLKPATLDTEVDEKFILEVALSETGASQKQRKAKEKRKKFKLGNMRKTKKLKNTQEQLKGNTDYASLIE